MKTSVGCMNVCMHACISVSSFFVQVLFVVQSVPQTLWLGAQEC